MGLNPSISFDRVGKNDIVVTVFDASNNSATYAFSVNVAAGQEESVSYGPILALVGLILLLGGLSVLGYRFWQRRLALDLLTNRGLSVEEAQGQMMMVAQQRTIPLLAKAEVYAGLDMGEVSPREIRKQRLRRQRWKPFTVHPMLPKTIRLSHPEPWPQHLFLKAAVKRLPKRLPYSTNLALTWLYQRLQPLTPSHR